MKLSFEQARVLAAMIEKAYTTPANYPMSLNAVVVACNQVSNRDPVTEFTEGDVELILRGLADDGLAKMVHRPGDRVVKYRQALDEQLEVDRRQASLLAVLMLRGAQTPGELRQRTGRYVEFVSLPELEEVLTGLAGRGLVERLVRQPGQKENRYRQLLTDVATEAIVDPAGADQGMVDVAEAGQDVEPSSADSTAVAPPPSPLEELTARVTVLEERLDELLRRLGEDL